MINTITSPAAAIWYSQRTGQPCETTFNYRNESITVYGRRFEDCPREIKEFYADDSCDSLSLKTDASWLWYFTYKGEWYCHELLAALQTVFFNAAENIENPTKFTYF